MFSFFRKPKYSDEIWEFFTSEYDYWNLNLSKLWNLPHIVPKSKSYAKSLSSARYLKSSYPVHNSVPKVRFSNRSIGHLLLLLRCELMGCLIWIHKYYQNSEDYGKRLNGSYQVLWLIFNSDVASPLHLLAQRRIPACRFWYLQISTFPWPYMALMLCPATASIYPWWFP